MEPQQRSASFSTSTTPEREILERLARWGTGKIQTGTSQEAPATLKSSLINTSSSSSAMQRPDSSLDKETADSDTDYSNNNTQVAGNARSNAEKEENERQNKNTQKDSSIFNPEYSELRLPRLSHTREVRMSSITPCILSTQNTGFHLEYRTNTRSSSSSGASYIDRNRVARLLLSPRFSFQSPGCCSQNMYQSFPSPNVLPINTPPTV